MTIDNCKSYLFHYIKYRRDFKLFSIRVLSSGQTGNSIARFRVIFTRSNRPILVQPTIDRIYVGANFETPCSQRRNFVILGLSFYDSIGSARPTTSKITDKPAE